MKKCLLVFAAIVFVTFTSTAQKVEFKEYDLDNGLHVILHKENAAPVVTVGVMYQIGAKDEIEGRTGFAHFFEHLLFEGTKNIKGGEWFKLVEANGGSTTLTHQMIKLIITKYFLQINLNLVCGWNQRECFTQ